MSRWWGKETLRQRSDIAAGRPTGGQVEPLAALVAVFAVGVALSAYAAVVGDVLPTADRNVAEPTAERVYEAVATGGVVSPTRLPTGTDVGPDGHRLNVTLAAAGRTWAVGPTPPTRVTVDGGATDGLPATDSTRTDPAVTDSADSATRTASVRVAPGRVRPGQLRVVVWS